MTFARAGAKYRTLFGGPKIEPFLAGPLIEPLLVDRSAEDNCV